MVEYYIFNNKFLSVVKRESGGLDQNQRPEFLATWFENQLFKVKTFLKV